MKPKKQPNNVFNRTRSDGGAIIGQSWPAPVKTTLGTMKIRDVSSEVFNSTVEKELSFLLTNGFRVSERTDTSLTAGVQFVGSNVAIDITLDRRDESIDCYLSKIKNGIIVRNNEPGGYWGHFHGFLVQRRSYRASFKEFRPNDKNKDEYVLLIKMYANAMKALAPDIISDSAEIFA